MKNDYATLTLDKLTSTLRSYFHGKEIRFAINRYMLTTLPGDKITAYCELHGKVYICTKAMTAVEQRRSNKLQKLFARTNNLDVLKEDPMWELEMTEEEFRKELQDLKHTT